jgi:hypothetical protein
MSGWVNFTAQGSTSAAGYVAIYNQTAWTTVLEGGNASPVWCSSWQNEFSCKSTGSLHIWEQPEGLFPYRDTSVLFCVWSQSNATIEEQVTYSWEST